MPERAQPKVQVFRMLGRFWTIPNVLSLLRLALVVPIAVLVWRNERVDWIFGLFFFGVITDYLDGRVARWSRSVSEWGKVLDPLADKAAAILVVGALTLRPTAPNLPLWLLALIVLRDLSLIAGGIALARKHGLVVVSVWWGKVAVTFIALTVLAALLRADPPVMRVCVLLTGVLLVYSYLLYLVRFARLYRADPPPLVEEVTGRA